MKEVKNTHRERIEVRIRQNRTGGMEWDDMDDMLQ